VSDNLSHVYQWTWLAKFWDIDTSIEAFPIISIHDVHSIVQTYVLEGIYMQNYSLLEWKPISCQFELFDYNPLSRVNFPFL
jgi:hypothetical protein